jgi:glutamine amidotransferase
MGQATLDDTHPFISRGYAFAHNGTVRNFAPPGASDSRAMFARILEEIEKGAPVEEAISALARDVESRGREHYTSITMLLTDGASIWGLRRIGADPVVCAPEACPQDYYTLGHARLADGTTVVSQEHELFGLANWTPIKDGELVTVAPDGRVSTRAVL